MDHVLYKVFNLAVLCCNTFLYPDLDRGHSFTAQSDRVTVKLTDMLCSTFIRHCIIVVFREF